MAWHAIIDSSTGKALAFDENPHRDLPPGIEAIELSQKPNFRVEEWDPVTRSMVPKPDRRETFDLPATPTLGDLGRAVKKILELQDIKVNET